MIERIEQYIQWVSIWYEYDKNELQIIMIFFAIYIGIRTCVQIGISIERGISHSHKWYFITAHVIICVLFQWIIFVLATLILCQHPGSLILGGIAFLIGTIAPGGSGEENADYSVCGLGYSLRLYFDEIKAYLDNISRYKKNYNKIKALKFSLYDNDEQD